MTDRSKSLTLHYFPGNASLTPHMILNEIGCPFELELVDRANRAQTSEAYLKLNPHGRIPVLVEGDLVLWETAAIVLHLVDTYPEAGLAPAVGTPSRAHFYKWIVHLTNTVQAEMRPYFYPEQHVTNPAHAPDVKATADARLLAMFRKIDALLGEGPYLLGSELSAVDHYLFMLVRWGRGMTTPPRTLDNLGRHAEAILERSAVQRTLAREGLTAPWI